MAAPDGKTKAREDRASAQTRIIVGLDTSLAAREALQLAVRLAASVDARLKGVFVEDENLLGLAKLPFAREISFSGEVRNIDPERMLRGIKAQAESARRVLARIASEAQVEWSFDIRRGRPLSALAEHMVTDDTLVIRSPGVASHEIGRAVRAVTRDARADVLLVSGGAGLRGSLSMPKRERQSVLATAQSVAPGRPVAAIDEGTSGGEACSTFAEMLAARTGAPFLRLSARGQSPVDLAAAARQSGVGILVVNADWLDNDDDAVSMSAAAGCPVLLLGKDRGSHLGSAESPM